MSDERLFPRAVAEAALRKVRGLRLPDWCSCPEDCDCDGILVCGVQAGKTQCWCQREPGHEGWHSSGNHAWSGPSG